MGKPSIKFLLSAFFPQGHRNCHDMRKGRERMKKWKLLAGLTLLLLLLLLLLLGNAGKDHNNAFLTLIIYLFL